MRKRFLGLLLAIAFLCIVPSACVKKPSELSFFAMDTYMTLKAYGLHADRALTQCREEIARLEKLLSVTNADGDIGRVNAADGAPVQVDAETMELLTEALAMSRETDGAFDPTVYPIVQSWGFFDKNMHVPDAREIASLLPIVGYDKVTLLGDTVTLPKGGGIDLGGVAKGYATDRIAAILREDGVKSAILSLGGNVYALGKKPDGENWHIAVQDPLDAGGVIGVVEAADIAVVTSGGYQRNFTENGKTYHHILNPQTGYPAESGLLSVTILCKSATRADALSTALFVMGLSRATDYWRSAGDFAAVFVTADGTVYYTEDVSFTATETGADTIIISK